MKKLMKKIQKYCSKAGLFSRVIVIFCLAYSVRIIEWAMKEFERSNAEAGTLLTVSLALFGGELLLLCMKRIFSKNDGKKISDFDVPKTSFDTYDREDSFDESIVG